MLKKLVAGLVLFGAGFIGVSYYVSMPVVHGIREDQPFYINRAMTLCHCYRATIYLKAP